MDVQNSNPVAMQLGMLSRKFLNVLLTHFRRKGQDVDRFLKLANISQKNVDNNFYQLADLVRFCQLAVEFSGDELFPMRAGRRMQLAEFPVIGALSMHSASMKQVIEDLAFFVNQTNKGEFEVTIKYISGQGYIRFIPASGYTDEEYAPFMDLIMAGVAYNCFIIAHHAHVTDLKDPEICFRRKAPDNPGRVAHLFQMPVKFEHEYNQIRIDEAFLDQPLSSGDINIYTVMKKVMEKTAAACAEDAPITSRIKTILHNTSQPNLCSIEKIASTLEISKSTLQRKLQSQNSSYRDIQRRVIETRAKELLLTTQQPIQDIALALGYLEITSFHRAFKRWTGMTAKEFKEAPLKSPSLLDTAILK